jgi:hypothetical protein
MQVAGILCSLDKAYAHLKHGSIHIKVKFLWILSGYMVSSVYLNKCTKANKLNMMF